MGALRIANTKNEARVYICSAFVLIRTGFFNTIKRLLNNIQTGSKVSAAPFLDKRPLMVFQSSDQLLRICYTPKNQDAYILFKTFFGPFEVILS